MVPFPRDGHIYVTNFRQYRVIVRIYWCQYLDVHVHEHSPNVYMNTVTLYT